MTNLWRHVIYNVVPRLLTGVVGIILYPFILKSAQYGMGVSNQNIPSEAIVSQLELKTTSSSMRFMREGLLVPFEGGFLGTRINPILTKGTFVFVLSQGNLCHSLTANLLLGETVSLTQQMESPLDLSGSIESLDLADNPLLREAVSSPDQVEFDLDFSGSRESLERSEFSDYDDFVDFSPIMHEPLDLVILRKQNLLTGFLEEAKKLDSRISGILTLFSQNWVNLYGAYTPEMPDFSSYNNPSYKATERDLTSPVYIGLKSGARHLFKKIGQFEGLQNRFEESSRQRERLQEDVETDRKRFCQLLSESDLREEYTYKDLNPEAQCAILTYFQNLSIEIERKRFAVALQESNEAYILSQWEQFHQDRRSIILNNPHLKREVIWEMEHSLLKNSQMTLEHYRLAIARLKQEIELLNEMHRRNLNLGNGLLISNQVTSDNWVEIHRTSVPDPDLSRFVSYDNPDYQSDPGPDISGFASCYNLSYESDEEENAPPV